VGKPYLDVAPLQCAGSRFAPHPKLSGKISESVVPHPPYSPDLAPTDVFLFPKLKPTFKGRRFQTREEINENAIRDLRTITAIAFQETFQQWKKHWEQSIASVGGYFEGDGA
jgi:histone-lysine N-methyltransferase SETMAR